MTTTTPSPQPGTAEAGTSRALELGLVHGSAGFRVHLFVCGNHGGYYEHATEAEAVADMERRRRDYGIMHCGYALERPKPRCEAGGWSPAGWHRLLSGAGKRPGAVSHAPETARPPQP